MAPFPPGKGGGEGVAYGHKGKGMLIHGLCEGQGRLLSVTVTPANGDERAEVRVLLDAIVLKAEDEVVTNPSVENLAADKGYDSNSLRKELRTRKIRPEIPRRNRPGGKRPRGRPIHQTVPRFIIERAWAWMQRKFRRIVVRWERRLVYFKAFLQLALTWMWTMWILTDQKGVVLG